MFNLFIQNLFNFSAVSRLKFQQRELWHSGKAAPVACDFRD